jgi:hypothetical protein
MKFLRKESNKVVLQHDGDGLQWRKSSFSNNTCVEAALYGDGRIAVRDSKTPSAGFLLYDAAEWRAFLAGVHNGEFEYLAPE